MWRRSNNKYHATAVYIGGRRFASRLEGERYLMLLDAERRGLITGLRCQVRFRLAPCEATYVADFVYTKGGAEIIEDTKGVLTDVFKLKADMMKNLLGKEIRIVTRATEPV